MGGNAIASLAVLLVAGKNFPPGSITSGILLVPLAWSGADLPAWYLPGPDNRALPVPLVPRMQSDTLHQPGECTVSLRNATNILFPFSSRACARHPPMCTTLAAWEWFLIDRKGAYGRRGLLQPGHLGSLRSILPIRLPAGPDHANLPNLPGVCSIPPRLSIVVVPMLLTLFAP